MSEIVRYMQIFTVSREIWSNQPVSGVIGTEDGAVYGTTTMCRLPAR